MPRIYTTTGDDGTTGLIGGKRVSKSTLRVEAYGSVDELNAVLGLARSRSLPENVDRILARVQDDLFILGANLALPEDMDPSQWQVPPLKEEDVHVLERAIDECDTMLPPLRQFILPGGSLAAATLHLARTVARRAERHCVALGEQEKVDPLVCRYLNRLSDLCFVLARLVNREDSCEEEHPSFRRG